MKYKKIKKIDFRFGSVNICFKASKYTDSHKETTTVIINHNWFVTIC